VTDLLEEFLRENSGDVAVHACGPKPMLRKVAETTLALRIPARFPWKPTWRVAWGLSGMRGKSVCELRQKLLLCLQEGPVLMRKRLTGN